jgi:hypothetical protein
MERVPEPAVGRTNVLVAERVTALRGFLISSAIADESVSVARVTTENRNIVEPLVGWFPLRT